MTDPILASDPTLAEIVRRIADAIRPERIYHFGSVAPRQGGAARGATTT